jgi:hypothetical protein
VFSALLRQVESFPSSYTKCTCNQSAAIRPRLQWMGCLPLDKCDKSNWPLPNHHHKHTHEPYPHPSQSSRWRFGIDRGLQMSWLCGERCTDHCHCKEHSYCWSLSRKDNSLNILRTTMRLLKESYVVMDSLLILQEGPENPSLHLHKPVFRSQIP